MWHSTGLARAVPPRFCEANTANDAGAVAEDYFWSIPTDELYGNYDQPKSLTLGQVSDSWRCGICSPVTSTRRDTTSCGSPTFYGPSAIPIPDSRHV
ncbi:hypothetical protein IFM12275_07860 [Nocardia sputorum]|nr:hypothetical protein IFM12275_07860 [Nocardia sputorum]